MLALFFTLQYVHELFKKNFGIVGIKTNGFTEEYGLLMNDFLKRKANFITNKNKTE